MDAKHPALGYLAALAAAAACTLAGWLMTPRFDLVNVAMVYLLGVVLVALRFGRGAAVTGAVVSVVAFDFLFVPPQGALTVDDAQYLLTFAIMVAVALVISTLMESRQRQAREQARLAVEMETERIRSTLLASISHDLRTPLAVMTGASSTLAERGAAMDEAEREALARSLYEQARDMSEQVTKLLQMTRLESGALRPVRDWADVTEIAGAVLSRLSERLSRHRLIVDLPDDLPLVRVDATLIEQALGNLLENAARHTPAGTVVRLRAERRDGELILSVEDHGTGLDERDLEKVFAKFHRGASEGVGGGVGLGLAIARAIVTLHGGRTWAERIPASGTAFRFSLPVETPPPPPADGPSD